MSTPAFDKLLSAARTAHEVTPDLQAFCDFPDDLTAGQWAPFMIRAGALMAATESCSLASGRRPAF